MVAGLSLAQLCVLWAVAVLCVTFPVKLCPSWLKLIIVESGFPHSVSSCIDWRCIN